jgi:hypothetical protein
MDGRLSFPFLELAPEGIVDDDASIFEQGLDHDPEARIRAQLVASEAPRVHRDEGAASAVGRIVAEELPRSRSEGVEIARVQR